MMMEDSREIYTHLPARRVGPHISMVIAVEDVFRKFISCSCSILTKNIIFWLKLNASYNWYVQLISSIRMLSITGTCNRYHVRLKREITGDSTDLQKSIYWPMIYFTLIFILISMLMQISMQYTAESRISPNRNKDPNKWDRCRHS